MTHSIDTLSSSVIRTPGQMLRSAREAQGIPLEDIARNLHLTKEHVRRIEVDNYDNSPGLVFVRGYLRSYARYLGLNVEDILQSFERLGITDEVHRPEMGDFASLRVLGNEKPLRWVSYLIGVGMLLLMIMWWETRVPKILHHSGLVNSHSVGLGAEDVAMLSDEEAEAVIPKIPKESAVT